MVRAAKAGHAFPCDDWTREQCPALWDFLTRTRFRDGSIRVPANIRIEVFGGQWLIVLQDHASNQQCTVFSDTLGGAWEALETALTSDPSAWREYRSQKVKNPWARKKPPKPDADSITGA
jgi:hypothetical protein